MVDVCGECGAICEPKSIAYLACSSCGGRWMTDSAIDDLSQIVARLRSDLTSANERAVAATDESLRLAGLLAVATTENEAVRDALMAADWDVASTPQEAVQKLIAELASARAQVELTAAGNAALAWVVDRQEQSEIAARAAGAFNAAVCHQQFAEWFRRGTPIRAIRGTGGTTLVAHVSDGFVMSEGDALNDEGALLDIEWAVREEVLALRAREKAIT